MITLPTWWRLAVVGLPIALAGGWMLWQWHQINVLAADLAADLAVCRAAAVAADRDAAILLGERQRRAIAQAGQTARTETGIRDTQARIEETIHAAPETDNRPVGPLLGAVLDRLRQGRSADPADIGADP